MCKTENVNSCKLIQAIPKTLPAGTRRLYNVAFTSMQHHDDAMTLHRG